MADKKVKVQVDIESNVEQSIAGLKELKKQLRETAAGSAEFKRLANEIDDLEDKLKGAKAGAADWIDTLESAGGPIGALGAALNKAKVATVSFGTALKAVGIGLIVSAVAGLVAAFNNVEGAGKKLEPLMIGLEKILGGIFEALTPLIDAFIELATKALPYITDGIKIFYSSLVSLFTLVKEGGAGVGKILQGIFTLDTKLIEDGFNQLKGSWSKTVDEYNATSARFEEGTKKLTKTQKENAKTQKEIADKAEEERKKKLAEALKDLEFSEKLSESELTKQKEIALGLAKTEQEKLDIETAYAKKKYDLQKKQLEDKQKLLDPKKDKEEYQNNLVALSELDANRIKEVNAFNEQQKKLDEDALKAKEDFAEKQKQLQIATIKDATDKAVAERQAKYEKDLSDLEKDKEFIKKSEEEKNAIRKDLATASENDINKIKLEAKLKQAAIEKGEDDARYARLAAGAANDLDLQRQILEQKKAADDEYYANALANENLTADQIRELNDKKLADQIFYTEKSNQIERDRIAVKQKALDDIISIVGAESEVGRAALVAKQILNAKELIMEVSKTITFSAQAAARSTVAVAEGTAQTAKVGFPQNIPLLIGYAAQAVGIIMAIKSAVASAKAATGGVGGVGGSIPSVSIEPPKYGSPSTSMATPQIQTSGGMNPSTQIAQTITGAREPIRAYVVSGEVSSAQALDRRTNRAATFAGG